MSVENVKYQWENKKREQRRRDQPTDNNDGKGPGGL